MAPRLTCSAPCIRALIASMSLLGVACVSGLAVDTDDEPGAGLGRSSAYLSALDALRLHMPGVAAQRLRDLLDQGTTENEAPFSTQDRTVIRTRLLEAAGRMGAADDALELLQDPDVRASKNAGFWEGMALAQAGRHMEAAEVLESVLESGAGDYLTEAGFSLASVMVELDRPDDALTALHRITRGRNERLVKFRAHMRAAVIHLEEGNYKQAEKELKFKPPNQGALRHYQRYLKGELALARRKFPLANRIFLSMPRDVPADLHEATEMGRIRALTEMGLPAVAQGKLQEFIEANPQSPLLRRAFGLLQDSGALERPELTTRLEQWTKSAEENLRGYAACFLARRQVDAGLTSAATETLTAFRETLVSHPVAPEALLLLAELNIDRLEHKEAFAILAELHARSLPDTLLPRVAYVGGRARYTNGEFGLAADLFRARPMDTVSQQAAARTLYNAGLARLKEGNANEFNVIYQELRNLLGPDAGADPPEPRLDARLLLAQGLYHASKDHVKKEDTLREFVSTFPRHAWAPAARLALAEVYLTAQPPQPVQARRQVEALRRMEDVPENVDEKADYLSLWLATAEGDPAKAIEAGNAFLEKWKESEFRLQVRMKLGEIFFAEANYPNALTQFELLEQENSESPLAESALFLAGKAAVRSGGEANLNKAISLWARLVENDSKLAMAARLQQALTLVQLDKREEALAQLDAILEARPADATMLFTVLMAKGEVHSTLMVNDKPETGAEGNAGTDPDTDTDSEVKSHYHIAVETLARISDDEKAPRHVRDEANFRTGRCHQRRNLTTKALAAYQDAMSPPRAGRADPEPTVDVWVYRAGFESIRLLEEQGNWEAAILIADRLAEREGTRAAEARRIADRLRLRHFKYEEKKSKLSIDGNKRRNNF